MARLDRNQWAVILISTSATLLLFGYEFVRNTTDTYFKAAYGPEALPIVMTLIIPFLLVVVHAYGVCLTRWGARRTLWWSNLASAAALLALYGLELTGWRPAAALLYIMRQCYVVIIVEQYWSFLNSTLAHRDAVRYYGPILALSTIGPICGDWIVWQSAESIGYKNLLLIGTLAILPAMLFGDRAFALCGEPEAPKPSPLQKQASPKGHNRFAESGLSLLWNERLLGCIAIIVALTQALSTFTTLNFQTILYYQLPDLNEQTSYSGGVNLAVNALAFALQILVVPIVLGRVPLTFLHLLMPVVHLSLGIASFLNPSLSIAASAYCAFKAFDYSLFRAAKEVLYIPVTFDGRYRAKQVIDSFGYRLSKGMTSLGITAITQVANISLSAWYPACAAVAAGLWASVVVPMTRRYDQLRKMSRSKH